MIRRDSGVGPVNRRRGMQRWCLKLSLGSSVGRYGGGECCDGGEMIQGVGLLKS